MIKRTSFIISLILIAVFSMPFIAAAQSDDADESGRCSSSKVCWKHEQGYRKYCQKKVNLQILSINDFHGQISAGAKVAGRPAGSAPVLASYLRAASESNIKNTFIVHAGDHIGASPPSSALLQDEPSVMFFSMLGNDLCSGKKQFHPRCNLIGIPGNHEFDEGSKEMLRLIYGGNHEKGPFLEDPYQGAGFPYICANVVYEKCQQPLLPPFIIKLVDGVPVAFIGAILKETPTIVTASGVEGLLFLDEADAVNKYVKKLKRCGIQTFILLIHQGSYQNAYNGATNPDSLLTGGSLAPILDRLDDEIDVVISGHAHGFTNTLYNKESGAVYLVTQAWSKGTAYADIDIEISRATRDVIAMSGEIVTTWADAGPGLEPDAEVAALVKAAEAAVEPITNEVIAEAAADITRAQNAAGESALGNLVADAQRVTMGTDFAFMNPGGIRNDILAGAVTWGELYSVQPFANYLVTMTLTGQQIYDLLNQQWYKQPYPRILQISGLSYAWDANRPENDRIDSVFAADGSLIDRAATYTATVNSFLAGGGDNFTVLRDGKNQVTGPIDLDMLIYYLRGMSGPVSSSVEGRIRRIN